MTKKQQRKGNVAATIPVANTTVPVVIPETVTSSVLKVTASKTTTTALMPAIKAVKSVMAVQSTGVNTPNKLHMRVKVQS